MTGDELVNALRERAGIGSDAVLAQRIGMSQPALSSWRKRKNLSALVVARLVAKLLVRLDSECVSGASLTKALNSRLGTTTLQGIATQFGVTVQAVSNWRDRKYTTAKQVAKLITDAQKTSHQLSERRAVRPLVEFFAIDKCDSRQGKKFELFSVKDAAARKHPYLDGLRSELQKHHGVYIFFDSRGQVIYAGKARLQNLWKEMNAVFNRDRAVQKIKRVRHPARRQTYLTSKEKGRQITESAVQLHELASYFSAYHVADGLVDDIESLLVRGFANDLLNVRMERFGQQKNK